MLLVASLESLVNNLNLLLLLLMMNDSMLGELKLRIIIERLRLAVMQRDISYKLLIIGLIYRFIRGQVIDLAIESRSLYIAWILNIHPRALILIPHFTCLDDCILI
jgi:hypothetical protein